MSSNLLSLVVDSHCNDTRSTLDEADRRVFMGTITLLSPSAMLHAAGLSVSCFLTSMPPNESQWSNGSLTYLLPWSLATGDID